MSVSEQLIGLNNDKQNIKTALTDKGIDLTNIPFTEYNQVISSKLMYFPELDLDYIYMSAEGSDDNTGSLNSPVLTFSKALSLVQNNGTILIKPGTYVTSSLQTIINKQCIIRKYGRGEVIFLGSGNHTLFLFNNQCDILIEGITFKNGTYEGVNGGAINNEGILRVTNCKFENNRANYGGGIRNNGVLTAISCYFLNNSTKGNGGGINTNTTATVLNCTFDGNTGGSGGIGALRFAMNSGTVLAKGNTYVTSTDTTENITEIIDDGSEG